MGFYEGRATYTRKIKLEFSIKLYYNIYNKKKRGSKNEKPVILYCL